MSRAETSDGYEVRGFSPLGGPPGRQGASEVARATGAPPPPPSPPGAAAAGQSFNQAAGVVVPPPSEEEAQYGFEVRVPLSVLGAGLARKRALNERLDVIVAQTIQMLWPDHQPVAFESPMRYHGNSFLLKRIVLPSTGRELSLDEHTLRLLREKRLQKRVRDQQQKARRRYRGSEAWAGVGEQGGQTWSREEEKRMSRMRHRFWGARLKRTGKDIYRKDRGAREARPRQHRSSGNSSGKRPLGKTPLGKPSPQGKPKPRGPEGGSFPRESSYVCPDAETHREAYALFSCWLAWRNVVTEKHFRSLSP